ncbi:PREDICTED: complement decay-accelerating factor-like [Nanorana parkeri]|uniref:complement decay-accelerating factor-like n=1 Tax=Nanorana parkeri TaxID=125878 RepID=UPI0008549565|nr:PREDICTED: complement decay-accelerating factor-like [Nanorana parkeri]
MVFFKNVYIALKIAHDETYVDTHSDIQDFEVLDFPEKRILKGDCPSPPNIPNTSPVAETSGTTGQEIVYTCDRSTGYYEIPGKSTTITCQADGTWTVIEEFCTRGCGVLPRFSEALPTDDALNRNIYLPNVTVTYNCRPGFVRIPGLMRLITCLENYTWSTPDPFCQRRSCGNPGEIENGEMETADMLFGSRVTYTCNAGYRMQSRRNYRDCQADGTWSNAAPQCDVVICEAPNVLSDITIEPQKDEYNYLDSVSFSCRKPLEIAGNASVHCTADGTWSSDFPTCKAVNCPDPHVPNSKRESGFVGPYGLNSAITFKCKEDFVLKGSSTITCNIDSQWETGIPECKKVSCGDLGTLANGLITYQSTVLGATATYKCNKGLEDLSKPK